MSRKKLKLTPYVAAYVRSIDGCFSAGLIARLFGIKKKRAIKCLAKLADSDIIERVDLNYFFYKPKR